MNAATTTTWVSCPRLSVLSDRYESWTRECNATTTATIPGYAAVFESHFDFDWEMLRAAFAHALHSDVVTDNCCETHIVRAELQLIDAATGKPVVDDADAAFAAPVRFGLTPFEIATGRVRSGKKLRMCTSLRPELVPVLAAACTNRGTTYQLALALTSDGRVDSTSTVVRLGAPFRVTTLRGTMSASASVDNNSESALVVNLSLRLGEVPLAFTDDEDTAPDQDRLHLFFVDPDDAHALVPLDQVFARFHVSLNGKPLGAYPQDVLSATRKSISISRAHWWDRRYKPKSPTHANELTLEMRPKVPGATTTATKKKMDALLGRKRKLAPVPTPECTFSSVVPCAIFCFAPGTDSILPIRGDGDGDGDGALATRTDGATVVVAGNAALYNIGTVASSVDGPAKKKTKKKKKKTSTSSPSSEDLTVDQVKDELLRALDFRERRARQVPTMRYFFDALTCSDRRVLAYIFMLAARDSGFDPAADDYKTGASVIYSLCVVLVHALKIGLRTDLPEEGTYEGKGIFGLPLRTHLRNLAQSPASTKLTGLFKNLAHFSIDPHHYPSFVPCLLSYVLP